MRSEMEKHPNFLMIGVVKGGTTSVYNYLNEHPDVFLTPIKETNHFSDKDMPFEHFEKQYSIDSSLDIEKYLDGPREVVHIAHVRARKDYLSLYENARNERALGEICNSYFLCPSAAREIFNAYPKMKLMLMLRNPVKRCFSQYVMNIREAKNLNRSFIEEIEKDYNQENKGWGASHNYLELGLYAQQLKRYFSIFDRRQIKILFFEDFIQDEQNTLNDIFDFIGVEKREIQDKRKHNTAQVPRSKKLNRILNRTGAIKVAKNIISREKRQKMKGLLYSSKNVPQIKDEEREYLKAFYRDEIVELQKMLNKDLSHWLR